MLKGTPARTPGQSLLISHCNDSVDLAYMGSGLSFSPSADVWRSVRGVDVWMGEDADATGTKHTLCKRRISMLLAFGEGSASVTVDNIRQPYLRAVCVREDAGMLH